MNQQKNTEPKEPKKEVGTYFGGDTKFATLPTDKIGDPQRPMRSSLTPESVEDLARSIKQVGLIQPVIVKKVEDGYELVAGHRRLLACEIAGLAKIPAFVVKIAKEIGDIAKVHENIYREEINPIDEAHYFDYLMKEYKLSAAKIGELVGKSHTTITDRLAILNYPTQLKQALETKQIKYSVARELAKIDDQATLHEYMSYAIKHGITPAVARNWKRDYKEMKERISQEPPQTQQTEEPPQTQQYSVNCAICTENVALKDARSIYVHSACLKKIE